MVVERIALVLALALSAPAATQSTSGAELYCAFWNVENLFDVRDDPAVEGDEEFTPSGPKRWTPERLNIKLDNLARVLRAMNSGRGADILGLCEVENRTVVEQLVAKLASTGRQYRVVHQESPSHRGIDTALVYDGARLSLAESRFHLVPTDPTRDILEAQLGSGPDRLTVFVNHWPSRMNDESQRMAAAGVLKNRIDAILAADPQADILVLGDLNDFPDSPSVAQTLGAARWDGSAAAQSLYDLMWPVFGQPDRGTYVYEDRWQVLDHVIASKGLADTRGFCWKADSAGPVLVARDQLFDPRGPQRPRPNRSYSGNAFHASGYSDHLPVAVVLTH